MYLVSPVEDTTPGEMPQNRILRHFSVEPVPRMGRMGTDPLSIRTAWATVEAVAVIEATAVDSRAVAESVTATNRIAAEAVAVWTSESSIDTNRQSTATIIIAESVGVSAPEASVVVSVCLSGCGEQHSSDCYQQE